MMKTTIAEFVSYLESLDIQLTIEGESDTSLDQIRLRCNAPEGTLTNELRQELAKRKAELIFYLHSPQRREIQSIQATTQGNVFPLSFAQQRLWFLYQLAPDNPFYNVPAALYLRGKLNKVALERSFQEIIRRHATLRTTFTMSNGQPMQVVAPNVNFELSVVNMPNVAVNERDRISQSLATTEAQRPFNLTTDLPLRVTLLQFDATEAVLLLTLHHIVADGWSLGVLIRELASLYTAFVTGETPVLPALPIQYTDFASWQRNRLQGEVLEKQLAYWRNQLQHLPALDLPSDRPRPSIQTYRGATYPLQLSPTLTQALESLSQQFGVSLFMMLLAAFQTLLYRYTQQEDIAIGSPIANRSRSEVEGLIGFFVNSLVMRSDLSGNPTFCELLGRVRKIALEAYEHQDLPFEKLVEELDPDRNLARNPLFQVAFALQNAPMQPLELPELTLEPAPLESGSTRFDLEVHLWEPTHGLRSLWQSQEGLSGFISYSTDLFDRDRIGRLIGHFQTLLEGIVANPNTPLSDLPLLTSAESQQILEEWNQSPLLRKEGNQSPLRKGGNQSPLAPLRKGGNELQVVKGGRMSSYQGGVRGGQIPLQDLCFHHIFEAQVRSHPNGIALVSEQASLTYTELNQRANSLADLLQQMGVKPNALVGLCVERSADMVIGILGILKAGGAYVPLDPNYPSDRLQFMLSDTNVSILLTQSALVQKLPRSQARILCLDQPYPSLHNEKTENATITPNNLAYVIYTSGSTGTPKGVLLSHRGLSNVVAAQHQTFSPCRNSRILQFSSLSFDASIFEIALALGSGSTLYIPPKSAQLPGVKLIQFLRDNAISHALLTPAVLAVLPSAELPHLKVLITGGEACSRQVLDRWATHRHFFNAYGPTETSIWATVTELSPGDNPLIIGRPILNTEVYILDHSLNPVPVGIPGELYIGGIGLAQGYLHRAELTTERFINVELPNGKVTRLYKTGDRVLYHPNGNLEFLGRTDFQIKIRGFRIELGEIEATLQRHPAIREAVAIPLEKKSSKTRLIAYFSLNKQYFQQILLESLQSQHIESWQTLYNQTYQAEIANSQFNITGWNSSYTGEPIPMKEMQEWVSDRVQQILAFKPQRVLEIGCGTGLLLFQIAPHTQQYVGTDFSKVSLAFIENQLERLNLPQVTLMQRMATDFDGMNPGSFDVVILNSIVQYFPSEHYLIEVIAKAIERVAEGGVLFLGDLRSLPLLNAFHTWMKFSQAEAGMERDFLKKQGMRSQFEEAELAIDPAFFYALQNKFPQIKQVQIRLSRGRSQNEMTQFRYNVLLYIKQSQEHQSTVNNNVGGFHSSTQTKQFNTPLSKGGRGDSHNWQLTPVTVKEIQQKLIETRPEIFIINNIPNSRINAAVKTANWLKNQEPPKTVGRMRELLEKSPEITIDPQDWWDLETVLPYTVEITWSTPTHTGNYDVLFLRDDVKETVNFSSLFPQNLSNPPYTNDPLQSEFARQMIPQLRQSLRQTLPDYMIPAAFIPLETLPLTASGKVNRHALPTEDLISSSPPTNAPLNPTELTLIEIWKELLQLKQVNPHDNFFELGGHSLLATQMTSRVRDTFGLELPLKSIFEAPTIAQLAPILDTLQNTPSISTIPPLVRLDRAAYRRKRSPLPHTNPQESPPLQNQNITANSSVIESRSPLVPLTLGSHKPPFFCVHPMFGVVFPYLELAQQLNSDRSFYGLQPLGLDGKSKPLNRIEAIASYYIQAIQILQPQGPYFIGGWSFGGLVAFEMAQQLTQAGHEIELLAIFDTPAPCHKPSASQSLKFLLGTALWSTLPFILDYGALATNRLQSSIPWLSRWQWSAIVRLLPEESRLPLLAESAIAPMLKIVYANAQAAYKYIPQPYPSRITLFSATEQSDAIAQNSTLGWNALARNIKLHSIPGNHLSLLKHPHVQTLAQQLREYL